MPLTRRAFAVIFGLLLLQLTLLGTGTLCANHDRAHAGMNANAMRDMAGMVSAASVRGVAPPPDVSSKPADCNGSDQHDGCRLPFTPGQCTSMTMCGVSATPVANVVIPFATRTVALAIAPPALVPAAPTFAPELPPPRA